MAKPAALLRYSSPTGSGAGRREAVLSGGLTRSDRTQRGDRIGPGPQASRRAWTHSALVGPAAGLLLVAGDSHVEAHGGQRSRSGRPGASSSASTASTVGAGPVPAESEASC
ncbi:hypothetical protein Ae707Ps1_6186 [Pseudonocardia sp. Ae707_Ps1]|nr:hypothetical protein Ae707Ps1_6186 [Pseudonocardia sp. Ae707_Ps1]